jgi:hypothetical protein
MDDAGIESKSCDAPDETRTPDKAQVQVVKIGPATVGRATMQPGWRWSESIKPIVGTGSCQVSHIGVLIAGRMHVVHDDGSEVDLEPGHVYRIEAGHDAWVVGDEPAVGVEFDSQAAATFAKP